MSRRTSSGSRFEVLPIEGEEEDSDSDSSIPEMKLSKDFYPTEVPETTQRSPQRSIQSNQSSDSSADEMQLSQEYYPATVPIGDVNAQGQFRLALTQLSEKDDLSKYLPAMAGASTSGLQQSQQRQSHVRSRSLRTIPESAEEPSDLQFMWDHFKEKSASLEVGVDALDAMFGKKSNKSEDSSQPPDVSKNIQGDVERLKEIGFNIDYPKGILGEGFYGVVYRGHYGENTPDIGSNRFAVKVIEFGDRLDPEIWDRRQRFETEKFILTTADHRNIVSIRMIINMGNIRSIPFKDNLRQHFLSPDRVYMIMDFADGGELDGWMHKNYNKVEPSLRINLMRDLFFGMQYLHSRDIVHGDVHAGNALIFNEKDGEVAKWSDFGLGFVGSNKQYRYRIEKPVDMSKQFRLDIAGMYSVFWNVMRDRHQCRPETQEEKKMMDEALALLRVLRDVKVTSLNEVHQQFKHILEDEFVFEDKQFQ